jgi:hypothetical protein
MPSVIRLSHVKLSIIMLIVKQNVVMLSVIVLNVTALCAKAAIEFFLSPAISFSQKIKNNLQSFLRGGVPSTGGSSS